MIKRDHPFTVTSEGTPSRAAIARFNEMLFEASQRRIQAEITRSQKLCNQMDEVMAKPVYPVRVIGMTAGRGQGQSS